jgi:hypothetical protein
MRSAQPTGMFLKPERTFVYMVARKFLSKYHSGQTLLRRNLTRWNCAAFPRRTPDADVSIMDSGQQICRVNAVIQARRLPFFCFSERVACAAFEVKRARSIPFVSLNLLRPVRARSPVRISSGYRCRAPRPIPRSDPRRHGRDVAPALDTGFQKTDSHHSRKS